MIASLRIFPLSISQILSLILYFNSIDKNVYLVNGKACFVLNCKSYLMNDALYYRRHIYPVHYGNVKVDIELVIFISYRDTFF